MSYTQPDDVGTVKVGPDTGEVREADVAWLTKFPHTVYKILKWSTGGSSEDNLDSRQVVHDLDEADVISSEVEGTAGKLHTIMLDLDVPAQLIPSSTPGHSHLYIDVQVSWGNYLNLLRDLANIGVMERGYVDVSEKRGFTSLRLPWVKKTAEQMRSDEKKCGPSHRRRTRKKAS